MGAAERLRLPEWYDDPATDAQRDYIAKLMADRGLGELKHAEAVTLRKGQASEMIDGLLAMPALRSATTAEPTTCGPLTRRPFPSFSTGPNRHPFFALSSGHSVPVLHVHLPPHAW